MKEQKFRFLPASEDKWKDVESLFGENGACGGCWCMSWLLSAAEFNTNKGAGNKRKLRKLITEGVEPGIIAYSGETPVAWCAFGKRETYKRLLASRTLKPVDDREVYSIVCFYIKKEFRNRGLSGELIKAAIKEIKKRKGKIVEAYPVIPYSDNMPAAFAWTGIHSAYVKAGFTEAARRSNSRPVMRKSVNR